MSQANICDICKEMIVLLSKFNGNCSEPEDEPPILNVNDLNVLINYVNIWNTKHCVCCYKDVKNFIHFNNFVQSIVVCSFNLLKSLVDSDAEAHYNYFNDWTIEDKEKLFHLKSKIFQLSFPLYMAYKHSNITKNDELTPKEIKILSIYCDLSEYEMPIFLMRKIIYFIEHEGFSLYINCFKEADLTKLPILFAHSMISIIQSIKNYFNLSTINNELVQLRACVINFLCKMQDSDLRVMNNRAMFEYIWSVVKEYNSYTHFAFDRDGLKIALKYFTSSTLTMRLSGLAQINNYISIYSELHHATLNTNLEHMSEELSQWVVDNNIIEIIFGPDSHVEVIKQSQYIFSFIANKITIEHIDVIWSSAQLKHYERYVFEILSQLIKNLKMKPVLYLYNHLWKIKPKDHTEHTLNLASHIIKYIWSHNGIQPDMLQSCYLANDKSFTDETALNKSAIFPLFQDPVSKTSSSSASSIEVSDDEDEDEEEFDVELNNQQIKLSKIIEECSNNTSASDIDIEINDIEKSRSDGINDSLEEENKKIDFNETAKDENMAFVEKPDFPFAQDYSGNNLIENEESFTEMDFNSIINDGEKCFEVKPFSNKKSEKKVKAQNDHSEFEFKLTEVCKTGNTLLWDIIQDEMLYELNDEVKNAAEKIFWNTICCASNRDMRFKFIDGCLDNLSKNYSVIISIRLLQKLFSSFYHYNDGKLTKKIIVDAEKEKDMLKSLFNTLQLYMSTQKSDNPNQPQFISHKEEIQIRLNFLSFIFIYAGSHESLSFSHEHINILWNIFTKSKNLEDVDEFFDWLLNQVKIHSHFNIDLIKHILFEKLPQLSPESFSLVSLELLQHLHGFILSKNFENLKTFNIVIKLLWDIAFKNPNNEVSMSASRHLNHYYINLLNCTNQFDKEEEFVQLCMSYLKDASIILPINCDKSLVLIDRAVVLLKTHLETFHGRYSYFFRKLKLTSDMDLFMHKIRDKTENVIRIMVNSPFNDKTSFEFSLTDYIGDLRAEVQFWWQTMSTKNNLCNDPISLDSLICLVLLDHEIPFEYDDKRLIDLGFKDTQSSHVTFNSYKQTLSKTLDILPLSLSNEFFDIFKVKNPKNLLLQTQNFDLLFTLMQQLDSIGNLKSRILSRNIWEIVQMLPTSTEIYDNFKQLLGHSLDVQQSSVDLQLENLFQKLFPLNSNQKLIYSCQIVDYLKKNNKQWPQIFIHCGGLKFVYELFIEEVDLIQRDWTEWKQDCLNSLIQILFQFAVYSMPKSEFDKTSEQCLPYISADGPRKNKRLRKNSIEKNLIFQFHESFLPTIMDKDKLINSILSLLDHVSINSKLIYQTSIWSRAQVISYALTLFTSWCYSDSSIFEQFATHNQTKEIIKKLILDDPDPMVRKEISSAFTRLCLGSNTEGKNLHIFIPKVLSLLLSFSEEASLVNIKKADSNNEDKSGHGPGSKDYFALVCRLIEPFVANNCSDDSDIDLTSLGESVANSILKREIFESRKNTTEDEGLRGMLVLLTVITKHNSRFKNNSNCKDLIVEIFNSLFALPTQAQRNLPKCKAIHTRTAAFDFLLEYVKGNENNYLTLTNLLMDQHRHDIIGRTNAYPWEYWPSDDKRSECGFVGLTNLGATCYMASCMQHLFMLSEARNAILSTNLSSVIKHEPILRELQKMFIFLQESERKAYNPKNFCKVYTMDHQPLNICEQKDMTEFFTDLITKLEEMTVDLKDMVKKHFSGLQSNNVVSLDCSHISQTTEEFYTLRCQVADMKDLYESLNEVTVKDTLEGANMYNCSKCGKMVRAEKRACIKKLPKILCFNTMRYTFNMATMTKEKVNTHFSFPFSIDMSPYLERNLLNISEMHEFNAEPEDEEMSTKYDLIGVTVHTGTADGGHYYSFIQDRDAQSLTRNKWFLFNDAEVKSFDKSQIPTECFGGEMTSKTYDQANDKFLDFSFEKTNSAYMLFYERNDDFSSEERQICLAAEKTHSEGMAKDLLDWISNDNISFLRDRFIFEHAYFDFIWQVCTQLPTSLPITCSNKSTLISTRLATLFVLETLIHAKEKPTIANWIELLTKQFNNSPQACEWLIDHLSQNDWWSIQILFKCSNQMVRQLFVRLCIHVIVKLKPISSIYIHQLHTHLSDSELKSIGLHSCVTRFIRRLISLIDVDSMNTKPQIKYLTEYFSFLLEFAKQGDEEGRFLLSVETISIMINFYLNYGKISNELFDSFSDNEDEEIDESSVVDEKYPKIASLDKMITLIVYLIEKTQDALMNLSKRDFESLVSGKTFQFIQQQIRDNINLRQTFNLICSIFRLDETLSNPIVNMLFSSIVRNPDNSVSFFKILSLIIDTNWIFSYFSKLILPKIWELAEHTPLHTLDWLIQHVSRNKIIHDHVLSSMEQWLIYFLVENSNPKVRSNAAQLLVSLVPSNENSFRQNYRPFRSFPYTINKEIGLTSDGIAIVDKIFTFLITQIKKIKMFAEPQHHGTQKLTNYFFVMSYFLINSKQKRLVFIHFNEFWGLFQTKLSEPAIPVHQNKQAFLMFWYLSCLECPENVKFLVQNSNVYRKIAFNYILADHEDQDVVLFNKNMLPYYYGILRLCCNQSRIFARYLSVHQNIQWAFKNITPHMNHYQLAVQELFKLMKIFVAIYPDTSEQELKEIANFKRSTIKMYLNNLDPNVHWGTLISVLLIIISSTEDMTFIILNNGLSILFQSFSALYIMFHQATACHITTELVDLLKIISLLLNVFEKETENSELNEHRSRLKDYVDTKKMLLLLNTYTPAVLRTALFDVLSKLIRVVPSEYINSITQFLLLQHILFTEQNAPFTIGPYFPKRGQKVFQIKSSIRPSRPIFQMCFSLKKIESFANDKEYERLVFDYYEPYYSFVEDLCRLAIKCDIIFSELVDLVSKLAIESLGFYYNKFILLFLDIYNDSQYNSTQFLNFLQDSKYFKQYLNIILTAERNFLLDDKVFEFMSIFLIENSHQIITQNMVKKVLSLIDAFCMKSNVIDCRTAQQFFGDMLAVKLICMSRVFDCANEIIVKFCDILQRLKSNFSQQIEKSDKTPPNKKIKLDGSVQSTSKEGKNPIITESSSSSLNVECNSSSPPVDDLTKLIEVIDDIINLIKLR